MNKLSESILCFLLGFIVAGTVMLQIDIKNIKRSQSNLNIKIDLLIKEVQNWKEIQALEKK